MIPARLADSAVDINAVTGADGRDRYSTSSRLSLMTVMRDLPANGATGRGLPSTDEELRPRHAVAQITVALDPCSARPLDWTFPMWDVSGYSPTGLRAGRILAAMSGAQIGHRAGAAVLSAQPLCFERRPTSAAMLGRGR